MAMVSCMYVFTSTLTKIIHENHPEFKVYGIIIAVVVFICAGILAVIKFILARRLNSFTLHLDAITSFFVSLLALLYIISEMLLHYAWDFWLFEHLTALVLAFLLNCYAIYNLCRTDYQGQTPPHTLLVCMSP